MKLLFIRHAESIGNQRRQMQGQSNTALSDCGEIQARRLGQRLLKEKWRPSHIYSSPLLRAAQTLEILMAVSELSLSSGAGKQQATEFLQVAYRDELREFQNGIFRGLTWLEAKARYPQLCDKLENSQEWIPIPGAESLQAGRDRAQAFIQLLLDRHENQDRIWIVTHHWILQQLVAVLLGCDRTWKFQADYTALFEFWIDRDRWAMNNPNRWNSELWEIHRFNDAQHLTDRPLS